MNKIFSLIFLFIFTPGTLFAIPVDVNFDQVPLGDVVKFVTTYKNIAIIYCDSTTPITWHQKSIKDELLIESFSSVLQEHNFNLNYSKSGYFKITAKNTVDLTSKSTLVFHLNYINADDLKESLQNTYGPAVVVESIQDSKILFVTASPKTIIHIQSVLKQIDTARPEINIFKLKHASVNDVTTSLNKLNIYESPCIKDFWNKQIICKGSPKAHLNASMIVYRLDRDQEATFKRVVNLSRINTKNALMVINSKDHHLTAIALNNSSIFLQGHLADLEEAIATLNLIDGQNVQIQIEAVIASLTDSAFHDFGLQLSHKENYGSVSLGATAFQSAANFTPTMLLDFINNGLSINANASEGTYKGEIVSSPFLTVLNGQDGFIHVGQNIPIITKSTENDSGSVSTSIERKDIGVKLRITPFIDGDFVRLKINQEISQVSPDSQGAADVVTEVQSVQSTVLLADGETIFLGGVKSSQTVDQENHVPILGAIPLLGSLFQYTNKQNQNRNLVISIRPKIISKPSI